MKDMSETKGESQPEPESDPNIEQQPQLESQEDSESKVEKELSPEIIEKIMEKVQDIDQKGTGYHALSDNEKLRSVLQDGLLGQEMHPNKSNIKLGKKWAKAVRKTHKSFVHFNIVGRAVLNQDTKLSHDKQHLSEKREIGKSYYMGVPGKLAIMFDIGNYKELTGVGLPGEKSRGKSKSFRMAFYPESIDKEGLPKPHSEYGFVISYRIAPRFFKGIVLYPGRESTEEEIRKELAKRKKSYEGYKKRGKPFYYPQISESYFDEEKERNYVKFMGTKEDENYLPHVKKLTQAMMDVDKDKPERLIPIYDVYGNLWWPKQMSYEEVKKFVEERGKNKKRRKK